ncbi:HNH endonuclease [Streptomyces griseus]|uniref:HNH endonuclease n=1 Tax=Streptomyces griseus TaxID=1911 RepID=UPI0036B63F23
MTKSCTRCKLDKPLAEFWKDKGRPDGLRIICRSCGSAAFQKLKVERNKRCPDCGVLVSPYRTYCRTHKAYQERSPKWKGGRCMDPKGYVIITGQQGHPNARQGGQVAEHILVMAERLGRALLPCENVHHKNGIRNDNRIENLELWSTSQPSGQRVEDKVAWAKEILALYADTPLVLEVAR